MCLEVLVRTVTKVTIAPDGETAVRLTLEVLRPSSPITGVVREESGDEHDFCGWTALASAIGAALDKRAGGQP